MSSGGIPFENLVKYNREDDAEAQKITGGLLYEKLREGRNASTFGQSLSCKPLEAIVNAITDKDYQAKQVEDFINRLHDALDKKPVGYAHPIGAYVKSTLGRATVLDQSVNAPSWVNNDFGDALDYFFGLNKYSEVSKDPSRWGNKRAEYEQVIIEYYGVHRDGTDMIDRFHNIKARLS